MGCSDWQPRSQPSTLYPSTLVPRCDRQYAVQCMWQRMEPGVDATRRFVCRPARVTRSRIVSLRGGDILPEMLQALRSAEERSKVCRIHHHDVAGSSVARRQPEKTVEFGVAC